MDWNGVANAPKSMWHPSDVQAGIIDPTKGEDVFLVRDDGLSGRSSRSSSAASEALDCPEGQSGVAGATFNLTNGIIGAGIVGLPFALSEAGFVTGLGILIAVVVMTHYTLKLLIETGRGNACFSYEAVAERAFGPAGYFTLLIFQALTCFGACVAYFVLIGDTLPRVLRKWFSSELYILNDDRIVTLAVSVVIVLPLCLYRDMSSLEKWSFVSLCSVFVMLACVVYAFVVMGPDAAIHTSDAEDFYLDTQGGIFLDRNHLLCVRMPAVCLHRFQDTRESDTEALELRFLLLYDSLAHC